MDQANKGCVGTACSVKRPPRGSKPRARARNDEGSVALEADDVVAAPDGCEPAAAPVPETGTRAVAASEPAAPDPVPVTSNSNGSESDGIGGDGAGTAKAGANGAVGGVKRNSNGCAMELCNCCGLVPSASMPGTKRATTVTDAPGANAPCEAGVRTNGNDADGVGGADHSSGLLATLPGIRPGLWCVSVSAKANDCVCVCCAPAAAAVGATGAGVRGPTTAAAAALAAMAGVVVVVEVW